MRHAAQRSLRLKPLGKLIKLIIRKAQSARSLQLDLLSCLLD